MYTWLTSYEENFKPTAKRVPPYDWSDITEQAKYDAAANLARSRDSRTAPYWELGNSSTSDSNWIAIWFIYHKFRYRDGRNRSRDPKKRDANKRQKTARRQSLPLLVQEYSRSSTSTASTYPYQSPGNLPCLFFFLAVGAELNLAMSDADIGNSLCIFPTKLCDVRETRQLRLSRLRTPDGALCVSRS